MLAIDSVLHTGVVADFCTCGAQLPPDARFCHKCGKPQRDEPLLVEQEAQAPVLPQAVVAPPPRVSFGNRAVVRACLIGAVLAFLSLPLAVAIAPAQYVGPIIAGTVSVFLYTRRTGRPISVLEGLQVGWITGVFLFLIVAVLFTAFYLMLASRGGFTPAELEMLRSRGMPQDGIDGLSQLFSNPLILPVLLMSMFMMLTILPMVGGAVGAKLFRRTA